MSRAIDDLKHEHGAIMSALRVLDRIDGRIGSGVKPPEGDLAQLLDFLREFADRCHHGKEEGMLFPALASAGATPDCGHVPELETEHDQGRQLIHEMSAAVSAGPDYDTFAAAGRQYSALLRRHIKKETLDLFPAAEKCLSQEQLAALYEQFERYEKEVIGAGRHEELYAILKRLRQVYPH